MDAALNLVVVNRPEEMARVQSEFETFAIEAGLSKKIILQVIMALEELVLNTILYGFPEGGDHQITVDITLGGDALICEIRDHGMPFDPFNDAPAPDLVNSTMERRVGGLGVHIVKKTMDNVYYCRDGGVNYTRITRKTG